MSPERSGLGRWCPARYCARVHDALGLSGCALTRQLGVPSNRITEIVAGERAITAETAILLAERFGTAAEFWLNLQSAHDLKIARRRLEFSSGGRSSGNG